MSEGSDDADRDGVEVTYSAGDILAMNLAAWQIWVRIIVAVAAVVTVVPVILSLIDGYPLRDSISTIDWPLAGWVILALMAWIVLVTIVSYWWRKRKGLLGPVIFALTLKGVSVASRQMDAVIFWSSIKSIKSGRERAFLFMTRRSGLIIPSRAFAGDAEFAAFVSQARQLWRSEHQGPK